MATFVSFIKFKGRVGTFLTQVIYLATLLVTANTCNAGCPDGYYQVCLLGCWCNPEIGGDLGKVIQKGGDEAKAQALAPGFQLWLQQSRNNANGGAQPIPPQIRADLNGFIEPQIMDLVRYQVGDTGFVNLANLTFEYGDKIGGSDVAAITLIDTIVFKNTIDAQTNAALWAHELTHIRQFRDWGLRDFALSYIRRPSNAEDPAYQAQNAYIAWKAAYPQGPFTPMAYTIHLAPPGTWSQACACRPQTSPPYPSDPNCQSGTTEIRVCPGVCPSNIQPYGFVCK